MGPWAPPLDPPLLKPVLSSVARDHKDGHRLQIATIWSLYASKKLPQNYYRSCSLVKFIKLYRSTLCIKT